MPRYPGEKHGILKTKRGFRRGEYIGPGTQVIRRLKQDIAGITPVDSIAKRHDIDYTLAQNEETKEKQLRKIREADKRMVKALKRIAKKKEDSLFNIAQGRLIQAKMVAEDLKLLNKSRFAGELKKLSPDEIKLLEDSRRKLEAGGKGRSNKFLGTNKMKMKTPRRGTGPLNRGYYPGGRGKLSRMIHLRGTDKTYNRRGSGGSGRFATKAEADKQNSKEIALAMAETSANKLYGQDIENQNPYDQETYQFGVDKLAKNFKQLGKGMFYEESGGADYFPNARWASQSGMGFYEESGGADYLPGAKWQTGSGTRRKLSNLPALVGQQGNSGVNPRQVSRQAPSFDYQLDWYDSLSDPIKQRGYGKMLIEINDSPLPPQPKKASWYQLVKTMKVARQLGKGAGAARLYLPNFPVLGNDYSMRDVPMED